MGETVDMLTIPLRLEYDYTPGRSQSVFLKALMERRILGQRSASTGKVYVPPRGSDPTTGEELTDFVEVASTGTVTTFCVVNVPFAGQHVACPYVCADVLLDGADTAFQALVQEVEPDEVHMGMRVEAVWADDDQMVPSLESIRYFRPITKGEVEVEQ
jgi:uncharacterized OB-fold protein